jgi:ubiquitin-like protein Pup
MSQQTYHTNRTHADETRSRELAELAESDAPTTSEHVTVEDIDEILDDIDAVLEENVLEVLVRFVQRGGQAAGVFLDTVARGFGGVTWRLPWAA